jgi:hypothetical protein
LHKSREEFLTGSFNEQGQQLIAYLHELKVQTTFESGFSLDSYRDEIHLSAKGQSDLAQVLAPLVE